MKEKKGRLSREEPAQTLKAPWGAARDLPTATVLPLPSHTQPQFTNPHRGGKVNTQMTEAPKCLKS